MSLLDNPIWNALSTVHAPLAQGGELAKRYPADMSPHAGLREPSPQAFAELESLLGPQEEAVLRFDSASQLPTNWRLVKGYDIYLMTCTAPVADKSDKPKIETLGLNDVPEMQRLATLTIPGPFRQRTIEFGGYIGIRDEGGRLVAMAGQRFCMTGFTEISAVCTHPDFRGRGYANALVASLARAIFARGQTPFLGVKQDNLSAIRVYEKLGFKIYRVVFLATIKRPNI